MFLFVAPSEVGGVADRFGATPFDVDGVFWSHRGEQCSFDTMVEEFGLGGFEALQRLAVIVRGADTAQPEIAPQSAGPAGRVARACRECMPTIISSFRLAC